MSRNRSNVVRSVQSSPQIEVLEPRFTLSALPSGFSETVIASHLGVPTAMDVLPDGRVLIAVQDGDLRIIKNGKLLAAPFLHLTVDSNGERGLIGVTHDPHFATNHFIYVYHTVPATGSNAPFNEISRFTADGNAAQAGSEVHILKLNDLSSATNHNGGAIHFGTDGMLYVGVGENADPANSQTLGNLLGKVLRIDVSHIDSGDPMNDVAKLVPSNNPFVGTAAGINGAIYALGFRNPFTFAVNPITGTIFVDDVGENTWEEIDKLVPGGNYGWHHAEGFAPTVPPAGLGPGKYQDPQLAYNHHGGPAGGGNAIIGGAFYEPPAGAADRFPEIYDGKYFYADYGHDWIRVFNPKHPGTLANPDTSSKFDTATQANPTAVELAPDGGLYYLASGTGELLEISASAAPTITHRPANQNAAAGASATFVVRATGPGPLIYRWQRDDGPGGAFINIPGARSSSFTLHNVGMADNNARFRVVVIDASARTYSTPAVLTIT